MFVRVMWWRRVPCRALSLGTRRGVRPEAMEAVGTEGKGSLGGPSGASAATGEGDAASGAFGWEDSAAELARRKVPGRNEEVVRAVDRWTTIPAMVVTLGIAGYYVYSGGDLPGVPSAKAYYAPDAPGRGKGGEGEAGAVLQNWSGTRSVRPRTLYTPGSVKELEALVRGAYARGAKLRPVGNGLSPNGLGFADPEAEGDMVSVKLLDSIRVDSWRREVTVGAGAEVQAVLDALRPYGLTLENLASIRAQQVGGWVQAGCHGTGATLPPVEEQVVSMTLVTPSDKGTVKVSRKDPDGGKLFRLAQVGLGCLGVVAEVTLRCVKIHTLVEDTVVETREEVRAKHVERLKAHRHLRYMWLPHTDACIVVTADPADQVAKREGVKAVTRPPACEVDAQLAPFRDLYREQMLGAQPQGAPPVEAYGMTELRDKLLALAPLNRDWVTRVNLAEAEVWRRSQGRRVAPSEDILGFDCGGAQWVSETALPAGSRDSPSGADVAYVANILDIIERERLPAPCPIEQRWTSASQAALSPVSCGGKLSASCDPGNAVFSWVGIIMYLPSEDPAQRAQITERFEKYRDLVAALRTKYTAWDHWAKIEVPHSEEAKARMQAQLAERYPVHDFQTARRTLDPKNVLGSTRVDALLPP